MFHSLSQRTAVIRLFAHIEQGRSIGDDADLVFYDVIIPTSELVNGSNELLCALVYAPNYDQAPIFPGIYRIYVEVCPFNHNNVNTSILIHIYPKPGGQLPFVCVLYAESATRRHGFLFDGQFERGEDFLVLCSFVPHYCGNRRFIHRQTVPPLFLSPSLPWSQSKGEFWPFKRTLTRLLCLCANTMTLRNRTRD